MGISFVQCLFCFPITDKTERQLQLLAVFSAECIVFSIESLFGFWKKRGPDSNVELASE